MHERPGAGFQQNPVSNTVVSSFSSVFYRILRRKVDEDVIQLIEDEYKIAKKKIRIFFS